MLLAPKLYKYECTIDQELSTMLHSHQEDTSHWPTRWQHFPAKNNIMVATLKVWRQTGWKSDSVEQRAHLQEEQSCQTLSGSNLKRGSIRLFKDDQPNNKKNKFSKGKGKATV